MGTGIVIHAVNDKKRYTENKRVENLVPFTYSAMVIASLALIGFLFLAVLYLKDLTLELACGKFTTINHFNYYLGKFGAFLSAFYSSRLSCLTFLLKPNGVKPVVGYAHEICSYMFAVLCILTVPSIFISVSTKDMIAVVWTIFLGGYL